MNAFFKVTLNSRSKIYRHVAVCIKWKWFIGTGDFPFPCKNAADFHKRVDPFIRRQTIKMGPMKVGPHYCSVGRRKRQASPGRAVFGPKYISSHVQC
jgi:hypothetical protein